MLTTYVPPIPLTGFNETERSAESTDGNTSDVPVSTGIRVSRLLTDHFRCPDDFLDLSASRSQASETGYFRFGPGTVCYGRCSSGTPAPTVTDNLYDALDDVNIDGTAVQLPFDPVQVVNDLRHERYDCARSFGRAENNSKSLVRKLYYLTRPFLSVAMRKHLQRIYLGDWKKLPFPQWPVDFTVENIQEQLLVLSMKSRNLERIPFIWFWPNGAPSCTSVTHDVETTTGWESCSALMDLDDSFGIKAAFQVVPEERYSVTQKGLDEIKDRGFELNVHDLNHDGNLMTNRDEFLRRAIEINRYGKKWGALGFRSAVLYRNIDWYDALDFSYEMSIPNVAHLDPQRGGCCTVFPFFNGKMLELPVTMSQDYSLFNILKDYSTDLWKKQIALIRKRHGLMQMIVHPDYIVDVSARRVYSELLGYLSDFRAKGETWIALPGEVAAWWRLRSGMQLVNQSGSWKIQGEGQESARIAYATLVNGKLTYEFDLKA